MYKRQTIQNSRAAIRRYESIHVGVDGVETPIPPENYGYVHALLWDSPVPIMKSVRDELRRRYERMDRAVVAKDSVSAECGRRVRMIYSAGFDPDEPDACPDCKKLIAASAIDPTGYARYAREERSRIRQEERLRHEMRQNPQKLLTDANALLDAVDQVYDDRPPELRDIPQRAERPGQSGSSETA